MAGHTTYPGGAKTSYCTPSTAISRANFLYLHNQFDNKGKKLKPLAVLCIFQILHDKEASKLYHSLES